MSARAVGSFVFAAALICHAGANAMAPLVVSRDGRLQATTVPGAAWCGDAVSLRLDAPSGQAPMDANAWRKFILGVRAAVTAECPAAMSMRLVAHVGGALMFRAWLSKGSGWLLRALASTQAGAEPSLDAAARREIAEVDAATLDALAGAQRVRVIDPSSSTALRAQNLDAAWRIANVSLGLTLPIPPVAQAGGRTSVKPPQLAAMIAGRAQGTCGRIEKHIVSSPAPDLARESFLCRQPPHSFAYGVIVYASGAQNHVVGLFTPRADADDGTNLTAVADSFEKIMTSDW